MGRCSLLCKIDQYLMSLRTVRDDNTIADFDLHARISFGDILNAPDDFRHYCDETEGATLFSKKIRKLNSLNF
jgi:hypothetical protein